MAAVFDLLKDDPQRQQSALELQASAAVAKLLAGPQVDPRLDIRTRADGRVTRFYFSEKIMHERRGMDCVAGLVSRSVGANYLLQESNRHCLTIDCPLETLVQKLPRADIALT